MSDIHIQSYDSDRPVEGQTWTTEEMLAEFTPTAFLAPYVHVRHKATGKEGLLEFKHSPRIYFAFRETA